MSDLPSVSPSLAVTLVFSSLLVLNLLVQLWLNARQMRHVIQQRAQVPPAFAKHIDLPAHQKAADYTVAKLRLGLLETAWGSALLVGWTLLGGLDALNQALLQALGGGLVQQLTLLAAFALVGGLLDLPLALYRTFGLEQRFGFNRSSLGLWIGDLLKATLVGALIGLPLAALVLWLMAKAGPQWWLWAWLFWVGFTLLMMVVYPTVIAPLFNRFQALEDASLRDRVTALMQRCGFVAKGLFVMDGSRRSAHANAYFTGLGRSKRVVFYDTLLRQLAPSEVEAVLAHELGHFHHRHIPKRMVLMFGASLAGFALLGWLTGQIGFYTGLGVRPSLTPETPNDALALILFLMTVPLATFFLSPLFSALSRKDEFQADAYAAQQAEGGALASALLKLHQDNASTLTPDPVYVGFYYSHPPAAQRLARLPAPQGA